MIKEVREKATFTRLNKQDNVCPVIKCKCCGSENINEAGSKDGYDFWGCEDCEFIFADLEYQDMVQTYQSGYHNVQDGAPASGWAESIEFLCPAFSVLPDRVLKIMDFGCGTSKIPGRLRKMGHRVIANDIIPPQNHHPDRLTGDILELDIPHNSFDLIYSYQVFEHIPEPRHVVRKLCQLLKKDGLLLIHTDMETEDRDDENFTDWWYVLPPDHCSFFKHITFEKMLKEFGCKFIYTNPKVVMAKKIK